MITSLLLSNVSFVAAAQRAARMAANGSTVIDIIIHAVLIVILVISILVIWRHLFPVHWFSLFIKTNMLDQGGHSAFKLGKTGKKEAVAPLIRAHFDQRYARYHFIVSGVHELIQQLGREEAAEALIAMLMDPSVRVRRFVIEEL